MRAPGRFSVLGSGIPAPEWLQHLGVFLGSSWGVRERRQSNGSGFPPLSLRGLRVPEGKPRRQPAAVSDSSKVVFLLRGLLSSRSENGSAVTGVRLCSLALLRPGTSAGFRGEKRGKRATSLRPPLKTGRRGRNGRAFLDRPLRQALPRLSFVPPPENLV